MWCIRWKQFFNAAVRMQKAAVIHLITNFAKENGNNGLIQLYLSDLASVGITLCQDVYVESVNTPTVLYCPPLEHFLK